MSRDDQGDPRLKDDKKLGGGVHGHKDGLRDGEKERGERPCDALVKGKRSRIAEKKSKVAGEKKADEDDAEPEPERVETQSKKESRW